MAASNQTHTLDKSTTTTTTTTTTNEYKVSSRLIQPESHIIRINPLILGHSNPGMPRLVHNFYLSHNIVPQSNSPKNHSN